MVNALTNALDASVCRPPFTACVTALVTDTAPGRIRSGVICAVATVFSATALDLVRAEVALIVVTLARLLVVVLVLWAVIEILAAELSAA
jgi:hypothetical protein